MDADSEARIYREFFYENLKYLDAIERLKRLGYDAKEAERVVSEWADSDK
jgi:Holliday junction resolvasome RuvABC DNA-binding subunit